MKISSMLLLVPTPSQRLYQQSMDLNIYFRPMFRRSLIVLVVLTGIGHLSAQITISGRIIDEKTATPLAGVLVSTSIESNVSTADDGRFSIIHPETGSISIKLLVDDQASVYETVIDPVVSTDLGDVPFVHTKVVADQELPTITLDDDEQQESASISGLLQSGGDLFNRITGYTFGPSGFDRRGLQGSYADGYLNYFPVNDLESGGVYWSNWGGLNDVMRNDAEVVGAEFAEWSFGGVSSTFNTDLRASSQRAQTRVGYAVTNRNYRNRLMGTWSTGLSPSGWAFSFSISKRWAQEGYIPGTYYDGSSYFGSIEKRLNKNHALNLVWLGSEYKRGGSSTSIQEMYDLAGDHYYNSYWGFQQGKKRSGRVFSGHQPIWILRHDWKLNEDLSITTALGMQTGKNSTEALDWFNAADPRPDYYRRLPSYVSSPALAEQIRNTLTNDPSLLQIQWDNLYQVNYANDYTVQNANGIEGQTHSGHFSQYIMEERRSDIDKKAANIVMQYLPGASSKVLLGINVTQQNTRNYKELADLLGGDYYVDWDKYAEQDFPGNADALQNDLQRPNRIVLEGDQFGYDYESRINKYGAWLSYKVDTRKWEIGVAGAYESQSYYRFGYTQNGKFQNNSLGEGAKHDFTLPSGKALLRYKIDGRNYLTVSGMYAKQAPSFRNAYISPRTRDAVVDGLTEETVKQGEVRYDLKSPYLKFSIAGFYLTSSDGIETASFYHDDERTFVNISLTGIDKRYRGIEAAVEYTLFPGMTVQGAAAIGEYIFTSRPTATITQDNDGSVLQENITVFANNLYVSGTPQEAYTVGMSYRSKKFWTLYLNVNRFAENWIDFNPLRRTYAGVDLVEAGSEQWNDILAQEKTDPAWTVDLSFYKSWLLKWPEDRALLGLNLGVANLLNNEDYINNGFEQYRYDFQNRDISSFPTKYAYMQGLNYFAQLSLAF